MHDDDLKYLFAKALERSGPGEDCPEPEVLFEAYHGLLPSERSSEVVDHIAVCPVCAEAWRLAGRTPAPAGRRR